MKKIHLKKSSWDDGLGGIIFMISLIQLVIGVLFLIPPILGAIFFTLEVFDITSGGIASLDHLSVNWSGDSNAMSAAPIYLGLMAIAGTLIVHSAVHNFISTNNTYEGINGVSDIEISEE